MVNAAFSPAAEEVRHAEGVVAALDAAGQVGRGAVTHNGRMVDAANIRMAQDTLLRHRLVQDRETS